MPDFSWQHNYYEHIIRQEKDLDHIRRYIATNPGGLAQDTLNIKEGIQP